MSRSSIFQRRHYEFVADYIHELYMSGQWAKADVLLNECDVMFRRDNCTYNEKTFKNRVLRDVGIHVKVIP